jgi:hypothetical protein
MLTLLFALSFQEAPEFSKFEFSRERVGHKITVDAMLDNPNRADLADLTLVVVFFDGAREVKRSSEARVAKVAGRGSAPVKLDVEQVAKFDRYEVALTLDGRTLTYVGRDVARPAVYDAPPPQDAKPANLEIGAHKDTPPKTFPGDVVVELTVKNAGDGAVEAREPTAILTFVDKSAAPVRKSRVRLADAVGSGAEDVFELTLSKIPDYAMMKAEIVWQAADLGVPAEPFTKDANLEVGQCRLVRFTDGALRVTGKLRNGHPKSVHNVKVTFKLGTASFPFYAGGTLKADAVRDFEFFVPDCPPCDGYSYAISHEDGDAPEEPKAETPPFVRRVSHKEGAAAPKPPPGKPADPPAKAGTMTVEVKGLKWVEGYTMVNKKYSGDVAFLRIVVRDADGKPTQPTGKFTAVLTEGTTPRGQVTRYVKKESWSLDAAKIDAKNVSHDIVAFDKATGELWLGLVRADKLWMELKLDVTLAIDKVGTWEWKGLDDKFEAKPKGPK